MTSFTTRPALDFSKIICPTIYIQLMCTNTTNRSFNRMFCSSHYSTVACQVIGRRCFLASCQLGWWSRKFWCAEPYFSNFVPTLPFPTEEILLKRKIPGWDEISATVELGKSDNERCLAVRRWWLMPQQWSS